MNDISAQLAQSFNRAQARLVVQTADLPLGTLAEMVSAESIDLQPGFQRRERWNREKQSALIESFLLNVPVPPIYLAEEKNGTYTAIDGKQRLRTITDFIQNVFPLRKLETLNEAEGFYFRQMPSEIDNALRLRPFLRVVTLLKQTDPELKYEVFLRLNRGGESLNSQEIRNVAFRGPMNDAVYEIAQDGFLRARLKIESHSSSAYRNMSDAEYVLRFLTLAGSYPDFTGNLSRDMDMYMFHHQEDSGAAVKAEIEVFETSLRRCEALWGEHSFKRPEGAGWRDQTLAGMYDAQMVACSLISNAEFQQALASRDAVVAATRKLFKDELFEVSVRTGTNTPARIIYRVDKMVEVLKAA